MLIENNIEEFTIYRNDYTLWSSDGLRCLGVISGNMSGFAKLQQSLPNNLLLSPIDSLSVRGLYSVRDFIAKSMKKQGYDNIAIKFACENRRCL